MSDAYQLESWCNPGGDPQFAGLIGEIFFATSQTVLDDQDRFQLNQLRDRFSLVLLGRRVHFWCVGHADYRGAHRPLNLELGLSRATSVQAALDGMFNRMPLYSASAVASRGEIAAHRPSPTMTPSRDEMASDRRVQIFASRLPARMLQLEMVRIVGRHTPALQVREIGFPGMSPTELGLNLAGRTSRPPSLGFDAPGDSSAGPGPAVGQAIGGAARVATAGLLERNIHQRIDEIRPIVAWELMDHQAGGILIVVTLNVSQIDRQTRRDLVSVSEHPGVFAQPADAIAHWRRRIRSEGELLRGPVGRIERRYYWATRR